MGDEPICCHLEADAYKDRAAWITALTQRALRRSVRNGLTLRLAYTAEVAADVCQMVEQERV